MFGVEHGKKKQKKNKRRTRTIDRPFRSIGDGREVDDETQRKRTRNGFNKKKIIEKKKKFRNRNEKQKKNGRRFCLARALERVAKLKKKRKEKKRRINDR